MQDNNPQPSTAPTDNGQGINIDNILGGGGVPMPDNALPPIRPSTVAPVAPVIPPTTDPIVPPVVEPVTAPITVPTTETDEFDRILLSAEGLSAEDAQLRTNILTKFGASNVDAQGNLLDANNRIVLTKANLDNYVVDGGLLLDTNGNHINELGEIITPAEQVVATNTFINAARTDIEKEYGFKFLDAEGKPKTYANTPEGNSEFVKDAINNTHVNAVSSFLESRPDLKQIFYHLETGGTIDNFVNETFDYTKVDVTTLSREQKLNYIKTSFDKQGLVNSASTIKLLEGASDEALNESTSDALLALNKVTENARTQAELDYTAQVEADEKKINDYWTGVKGRIDGGKIRDINIPATEKDKFYEYLSVVKDNQGRSQEMIDMATEDPDFNLMVSYLRYKKLDLSALIDIRARGNKLHNARERFNISQPAPVTSAPASTTSKGGVIRLEDLQ